jgi:hypothetical protein
MATDKTSGQNEQGANDKLGINEKELIKLAIREKVRDMKDPTKFDPIPNNPSWNDSGNAVKEFAGGNEAVIEELSKANGGSLRTLSLNQWTEEAFKIAKRYIDTSKIQIDNAEMKLVKIGGMFETWYKKQKGVKDRKAFKGEKLTAIDYFGYMVAHNREIPKEVINSFHFRVDKQRMGSLEDNVLDIIEKSMVA